MFLSLAQSINNVVIGLYLFKISDSKSIKSVNRKKKILSDGK